MNKTRIITIGEIGIIGAAVGHVVADSARISTDELMIVERLEDVECVECVECVDCGIDECREFRNRFDLEATSLTCDIPDKYYYEYELRDSLEETPQMIDLVLSVRQGYRRLRQYITFDFVFG